MFSLPLCLCLSLYFCFPVSLTPSLFLTTALSKVPNSSRLLSVRTSHMKKLVLHMKSMKDFILYWEHWKEWLPPPSRHGHVWRPKHEDTMVEVLNFPPLRKHIMSTYQKKTQQNTKESIIVASNIDFISLDPNSYPPNLLVWPFH